MATRPFPCQADRAVAVCAERRAAVLAGAFVYDWQRRAWIATDVPPRRVSWRARFYETSDADGEPVTWVNCPFCGGDLPDLATLRETEQRALGQGDGGSEGAET